MRFFARFFHQNGEQFLNIAQNLFTEFVLYVMIKRDLKRGGQCL